MRLKMQYLVVLAAIVLGWLLLTSLASAQKKAVKTVQPAAPVESYVNVSGRSTTPGANAAEEQNHCFKGDPSAALNLTITSTDATNHPLPENGTVTVQIINLDQVDQMKAIPISPTGPLPTMDTDQSTATINNGQALVVTFPGDCQTCVHLPTGGPMSGLTSTTKPGYPYSNLAIVTMPKGGMGANATETVAYFYRYKIWKRKSSECAKKP